MAKSDEDDFRSGNDPDRIVAKYGRLAADYDRRWSSYLEASLRETRKRLDLGSGLSVLDVGCGTGTLLKDLSLSAPSLHLVGVDPTVEMLQVARISLGDRVMLVESYAEQLPLATQTFDAVVSMSTLHYFTDPAGALKEMARVLRPGGQVVVTDWCADYLLCRCSEPLIRVLHPVSFRTYRQAELKDLLIESGFTGIRIDRYKINWFWGLMTAVAWR